MGGYERPLDGLDAWQFGVERGLRVLAGVGLVRQTPRTPPPQGGPGTFFGSSAPSSPCSPPQTSIQLFSNAPAGFRDVTTVSASALRIHRLQATAQQPSSSSVSFLT